MGTSRVPTFEKLEVLVDGALVKLDRGCRRAARAEARSAPPQDSDCDGREWQLRAVLEREECPVQSGAAETIEVTFARQTEAELDGLRGGMYPRRARSSTCCAPRRESSSWSRVHTFRFWDADPRQPRKPAVASPHEVVIVPARGRASTKGDPRRRGQRSLETPEPTTPAPAASCRPWPRQAYRRPVVGVGHRRNCSRSTRPAAPKADPRSACSGRSSASSSVHRSYSGWREQPDDLPAEHRATASAISSSPRACRSSCGAAFPTTSCSTLATAGKLREPAVLEKQVRRMLRRSAGRGAGHQFRRPVAVPAQPASASTRDPSCSRTSTTACAQALPRETELFFDSIVREDRSVARSADRRLHLRQRAAGAALRHSRRLRRALPPGDASATTAPRRIARPGEHLTVTSLSDADVAGDPRQVDSREHPRHAAAAAAAERPAARRRGHRTATSCSRCGSGWRAHRANPACASCHALMDPLGLRARELRRDRPMAHDDEAGDRSTRPASCRTAAHSKASTGLREALLRQSGVVRRRRLTEKLLTYALGRGVEYYDMPAVREHRARRRARATTDSPTSSSASSTARRFR